MCGSWKYKHDKLHVKDNRSLYYVQSSPWNSRIGSYSVTLPPDLSVVHVSTIAVREESPGAPSTKISKGTQIIPSKPYANTRYLRNTAEADEVPESPL